MNDRIKDETGALGQAWSSVESMIPGWSKVANESSVNWKKLWNPEYLKIYTVPARDQPSDYPPDISGGEAKNPLYKVYQKLTAESGGEQPGGGEAQPGGGIDTTVVSAPQKGDVIEDTASKASYIITSTDAQNMTVTFVSALTTNVTGINVPAEIKKNGKTYKVTEIKAGAFKNNKKLKKITIGKNIKKIGKNAFYGCKNLKTIKIMTTLLTKKTVGAKAFKGINEKARVKVPKSRLKVYKTILKARGIKGKKQKITK